MNVVAFIKLGRPQFLGGGFLLYALGAAIARAHGHSIDVTRYVLGQAAVTAYQWMTHYANEYFDYEADRANATPTRWSGGSRMLLDGTLPRGLALGTALVLAAIGIVVTLVLAPRATLAAPTLAIVLVLAWAYSAPPLRLCAAGLGELATTLVVTVLVPWLGFYLQAPHLDGLAALAFSIVPPALYQFAMMIAIEVPDAAGDAATGKRTLVVRFGKRAAARLYIAATATACAWPAMAALAGLPARVVIAMVVPVPIAVWRMVRVDDEAEKLTQWAVLLLVVATAAVLIAWLT